jgi:anti-anti-sigma factor
VIDRETVYGRWMAGRGPTQGRIVVETDGQVSVVSLHGEHDFSSRPRLEALVATLLEQSPGVVVDLGEAEFLNVPVLGALRRAADLAAKEDKGFAVSLPAAGSWSVRRLFEVTAAHELFPVVDSVEDGVALVEQTVGDR